MSIFVNAPFILERARRDKPQAAMVRRVRRWRARPTASRCPRGVFAPLAHDEHERFPAVKVSASFWIEATRPGTPPSDTPEVGANAKARLRKSGSLWLDARPVSSPPIGRTRAGDLTEHPRQMALVGEAAAGGNGGDAVVCPFE